MPDISEFLYIREFLEFLYLNLIGCLSIDLIKD